MSQPVDMNSPESDDSDPMVAQLRSQLESSTPGPATTANESRSQHHNKEVQQLQEPEPMKSYNIEIRVPIVDNPGDYEYLPGHFEVRCILRVDSSNPERPLYTVRLASGERATVRTTPSYIKH